MFKRFRPRRPSAPLVISLVALFFAVGGVGYAAVTLPPGSVGNKQLRNNAVSWQKIAPGTIGNARINQTLVQTRVKGSCADSGGAITQIAQSGNVVCNPTSPKEFGSSSAATPVTATSTAVASRPLTTGSYLLLGDAYASNTGPTASTVTCTLTVPGASTVTRSVTVRSGGQAALPINLASSVPSSGATSSLACTQTGSTVDVAGQINAIQTASNS
jgi:hypothetical protein